MEGHDGQFKDGGGLCSGSGEGLSGHFVGMSVPASLLLSKQRQCFISNNKQSTTFLSLSLRFAQRAQSLLNNCVFFFFVTLIMLPRNPNNGGTRKISEAHRFSEDLDLDDSTCSTPYVSAPSSPGREAVSSGYFFSAPASPVHYMLSSSARSSAAGRYSTESTVLSTQASDSSSEFEFASKLSPNNLVAVGSMSSADELFCNGQIKPVKLSSHLQRCQILSPLVDLEIEEEEEEVERRGRDRDLKLRSRSVHRKARSLSPLRTAELETKDLVLDLDQESKEADTTAESSETTPSSSRSSSSGRNSKKWIFLKDLLHRSKSEGTAQSKDRFWPTVTFSPSKEKRTPQKKQAAAAGGKKPPANGISRRRAVPSAHEVHYTTSRAQAEEMKKRTYLPYRQGLLGCLGFSSKGYGALTGFTKTLNPVSSR